MNSKYLLGAFLLVTFFINAQNSYKTIEKSGKRPDWLNGTDENYIITYGSGPTSEAAKEQCLANIRTNIANAIAIQVSSKTEIDIQTKNGKSDEKFKYSIVSQTANLPSLNGISINKAKDYYWEKLIDKQKNIVFGYHMKYPFSKGELNALIEEYDAMDMENTRKIKQFERLIDTTTSFERLESSIVEIENLQTHLVDDRKDKIKALLERLKATNHPYSISPVSNNAGEMTFTIKNSAGKNIHVSTRPIFTSKCAKLKSFSASDTLYTLSYEYDLCKYVELPELKLTYAVGGRKFDFIQSVDVNLNKVELSMAGDVSIRALTQNPNDILESECEISLNSKYNYPFKVMSVQLKIENEVPITVTDLNYPVEKSGTFKIMFKNTKSINKQTYSHKTKAFPYISCVIQYYNVNTKKDGVVKLSNQRYTTDW